LSVSIRRALAGALALATILALATVEQATPAPPDRRYPTAPRRLDGGPPPTGVWSRCSPTTGAGHADQRDPGRLYWIPKGAVPYPQNYIDGIDGYLADSAADSGLDTNVYSVEEQYYDTRSGGQTHIA